MQEVTDAQGRRRFHGAFTGGFSAGYFNTAGSAEGWAPSTFRSSRSDPQGSGAATAPQVQQTVEQFLDEDELEALRQTNLQTTSTYDTFGSTAAEAARRAAAEESQQRPSAIPGLLPEEAIAPVAEGIGIQLLQRMGWRQGKGVGAAAREESTGGNNSRSGWGKVAGIGPDNTPLHLVQPKHDVHGIGYDPFKGAEEFRKAAQQHHQQKYGGGGAGGSRMGTADQKNNSKRRRGVAFGSGVLDEDDTFGMMEDYVTHDDVESYEEVAGVDQEGLPLRRGPIVQKQNLGDRLALQGFAFEIQDEEESDEDHVPGGSSALKKQRIHQLTGSTAPLLLKQSATELHEERKKGLIDGFVLASKHGALHKPTYYPPPVIPNNYIPVYRPVSDNKKLLGDLPTAAPLVTAPKNEVLRQAIERLAFFVARNGPSFEVLAREQQQRALASGSTNGAASTTAPHFSFLLGGEGADYYLYKRATLQALLAPRGRGGKDSKPLFAPIGQRSAPLTAEDRGAMLGEQPLPASTSSGAAVGGRISGGRVAAAATPAVPLARSILNLAEEDRKRLSAAMGSTFVRAEAEGDKPLSEQGGGVGQQQAQAGLRPGVAPIATTAPASDTLPGGDMPTQPQKVRGIITREDLIQSSALQNLQQGQRLPELPIRKSEEWRPEPLLCKRLDVPDPYHGKPKEIQMSRFRTDHVALPATAEALGRAAAAAAPSGVEFLVPPALRVAAEEAAAAAAAQKGKETAPLPPPAFPPPALPQQQRQQQEAAAAEETAAGAGEAAEAFLSSLFDQGSEEKDREKAEEEVLREVAVLDKPVDLFKAIFEDSSAESEEEEEEEESEAEEAAEEDIKEGERAASLQQQQDIMAPSAITKDSEFGFQKFKGRSGSGGGNLNVAATGEVSDKGRKDTASPSGLESLDPGMRSRVEAALKVLKESKKKHKGKRKRKKERKDRDASSSKRKRREKKRKNKKRNSSDSSGENFTSNSESD